MNVFAKLEDLDAKASKGEWFVESVEVDGAYGNYLSFKVHAADAGSILDAINSDVAVIAEEHDEDGGSQWDQQGEADAQFAAECVNYVRSHVLPDRSEFVTQTTFHDTTNLASGNCTEAAVASILGLDLSAVPNFRADGLEPWRFWSAFRRFIRSQGFEPLMMNGNMMPDAPYLASGMSARGVPHMVVMRGGELLHDPHPSRSGIEKQDHVWLLLPSTLSRPRLYGGEE